MRTVVFVWVVLMAAWGAAEKGARADEPADSAAVANPPPQLRILIPARAGPVGALRIRPIYGQRPLLIIRGEARATEAPRAAPPGPESGAATVEDLARLESRLIEYLDRRLGEPVLADAPSMEPSVSDSAVAGTTGGAEPLTAARSRSGPASPAAPRQTTKQSTRVIPIVVPLGSGRSEEPTTHADTAGVAVFSDTTLAADTTVSDSVRALPASPADATGLAAVVDQVETAFLDTELFRATGVLFESNSADLLPASAVILSAVGTVLDRYPEIRLEIRGHSDSRGSDTYNLYLSELRAEAVRAYLLSNFSIDASRLSARGYGESQPVAAEDTPTGCALNRRVDFVVVK